MTMKTKTRKPPAVAKDDPIFAMIAEHKALIKKMYCLYNKLGEAEFEAMEAHGERPKGLIPWRHYSPIGGTEIDARREEFLSQPSADRKQVENEYLDAKAGEAAAERAGAEWDERGHRTATQATRARRPRQAQSGYANGPDEADNAGWRGCLDRPRTLGHHDWPWTRMANGRTQNGLDRACRNEGRMSYFREILGTHGAGSDA